MTDQEPNPGPECPRVSRRVGAAAIAALALALGDPAERAAKKAKVTTRTITRWLKKKPFRDRVNAIRDAMTSEAIGKATKSMVGAVRVLERLTRSKDERVRLRAAVALAELGIKLRFAGDVTERLAEVERQLNKKGS